MHEPLAVCRLERVGERDAEIDHLVDAQAAAMDPSRERLAFEQLHREKRHVAIVADVIDHADVGVAQRRCGARFALKPLDRFAGGSVARKKFQRDQSTEPRIERLVDLPHPAAAEQPDDLVWSDLTAGTDGHVGKPDK